MTGLEELKLWYEVVQRTSIPLSGERLSENEKLALAQSCRILAQIAILLADKMETT